MSHRQLVRTASRRLVHNFIWHHLKNTPCEEGRKVEIPSISAFDHAFMVYWNAIEQRHKQTCKPCKEIQACFFGDTIQKLRPDPVTGVSVYFHEYLLANGQFDLVTGHGTVLLEALR
ncbi:MAG: hypothetical protein WC813_02810 [Patescibacteria group bacterium]